MHSFIGFLYRVWQRVKWLFPKRLRACLSKIITISETDLMASVAFRSGKPGTMFDVGANKGVTLLPYAKAGWQVHAFEPDPKMMAILTEETSCFPNVVRDNRAISNEIRSDVAFYSSDISTGISTLTPFHESHKKTASVDIITLEKYCNDKGISGIDVLKIDTEGYDLFVLKGLNWDSIKPRMILAEFEDRKTVSLKYTFQNMADYLRERGYFILVSEWYPVVRYGGPHKWREIWVYPGQPRGSDLAHGNIIAVRDPVDFQHLQNCSKSWYWRTKLRNLFYGL
ncbi:MAG: FkbM family methyltransferase [bacterium]